MSIISKVASSILAFGKKSIFHTSLKGPFIIILIIYVLMIVLPYLLLIQAMSNNPDIVDKSIDKMIKLFTLAASESIMLAAAFIGGMLTDNDHSGIPDLFDKGGKYDNMKPDSGCSTRRGSE